MIDVGYIDIEGTLSTSELHFFELLKLKSHLDGILIENSSSGNGSENHIFHRGFSCFAFGGPT